jgi:hypothetical protein
MLSHFFSLPPSSTPTPPRHPPPKPSKERGEIKGPIVDFALPLNWESHNPEIIIKDQKYGSDRNYCYKIISYAQN